MSGVPQSTFNIGLAIAREDVYGVAPSLSANPYYWQGGPWVPITVSGTPDLWDRQATIFPEGRAGSRARYNRRPVVGRRWSDGDFSFDVTMDFLPLIVYGALGSMSSNSVPSTNGASMLELEPVAAATSKSIVLVNQPGDGGAILQIYVGSTSAPGWVNVQGVDSDGFSASEIISFTSSGSLYTRTSFSAIGASSITAWSDNDATISINGIKYFQHIVSVNGSSNPTFSIQSMGDPSAGATSRMRVFGGMLVTEFELSTPAEARDGLITGSVSWEGRPTATCDLTDLPAVSAVRVWPAWTLSLTRDSVPFEKALDLTLSYTAGNRNYRTAVNQQGPQGAFFGSNMLEGSMRLLFNDESEYEVWSGASSNRMVATWTSPYKLSTGVFQKMTASLTELYYSEVSRGEDSDMQILEVDVQSINSAEDGILKMEFLNNIPPNCYS
jgi:hypothetical protein